MAEASESVRSVIERHEHAFAQLQKQFDLVDQLDDEHPASAVEHLELLRLENEVEEAALAMTTVDISAVEDVVVLLRYIDQFSRTQRSGYLLWPEVVSIDGKEGPWAYGILEQVRRTLELVCRIRLRH
jgi:hypothetical protein